MDAKKTTVWDYFQRSKDRKFGMCNECKKQIKCEGSSTSGMISHLKSQHKINIIKRTPNDDSQPIATTSKAKIADYFVKRVDDSFPAVLARLTTKDNISFKKVATSYDLHVLFKTKYTVNIPKSPHTVKGIVMEYSCKIKKQIIPEIMKNMNSGLSLTFDEWTSLRNRRYMNVNVHSIDKFWNLGLIRIEGTMPATKCVELLEVKLKEFGISLRNITSITTDGASVMKKVGRLLNKTNHQICLAHGIQLAVNEVLYKKREHKDDEEDEEESILEWDEEYLGSDDEFEIINNSSEETAIIEHISVNPLIMKVRKIIVMFKRSPTKNDILQKYIKEEFKRELSLILDCKTRWNSLLIMLERFDKVINCIRKTLIDIQNQIQSNIEITEDEIIEIKRIIAALQPIKVAVEALCRRDVDLYVADVTLKFMLDEISTENTKLSIELKEALIQRIIERRNILSDVFQYLSDPSNIRSDPGDNYNIFQTTSRTGISRKIVELIQSPQPDSESDVEYLSDTDQEIDDDVIVTSPTTAPTMTMSEKLQLLIHEKTTKSNIETGQEKGLNQKIKKEMDFYQDQNIKGKYLTSVYNQLKTIRPTSVEAERAFSVADQICTKFRSSLDDSTLDNMCFLRAFFNSQEKVEESA